MSTPTEALNKLKVINGDAEGEYAVLIYYINRDLVPNDGTNPPLGVVFPCGYFNRQKDAIEERDRLSSKLGAHSVVVCPTNRPFALRASPTNETITYSYKESDSVDKINESIKRAKERKCQIDAEVEKEVEERDDINSMSYLVNKIYLTVSSLSRAQSMREQADKCQRVHEENFKLVLDHFENHPEHRSTWEEQLNERLTNRGEFVLRDNIIKIMKSLEPQIDVQSPVDN